MPVTVTNGVVTLTTPTRQDLTQAAGAMLATQYSFVDGDVTKQIKLDPSALTTQTSLTLTAPSGTGGVVTLPLSGTVKAQTIDTLQYSASAEGATVTVTAGTETLISEPAGDLTALTIALPAAASTANGTTLRINCTKAVAGVTFTSTGATFVGAPSALVANTPIRWIYRTTGTKWYLS